MQWVLAAVANTRWEFVLMWIICSSDEGSTTETAPYAPALHSAAEDVAEFPHRSLAPVRRLTAEAAVISTGSTRTSAAVGQVSLQTTFWTVGATVAFVAVIAFAYS